MSCFCGHQIALVAPSTKGSLENWRVQGTTQWVKINSVGALSFPSNWSTVGWYYKLCLSRHCLLFLYSTFIFNFLTAGAVNKSFAQFCWFFFWNIQNFTCTIWNSRETFNMICHLIQRRSYEAGWSVLELQTRGAVHFLLNIKLCGETLSIKNMNMAFFEITF